MAVHLSADEMLAVILYTGSDCYSDLRKTMRDYGSCLWHKWIAFIEHLTNAILKLIDHDDDSPVKKNPENWFRGSDLPVITD